MASRRKKNPKNLYLDEALCQDVDLHLTKLGETHPRKGEWSNLIELLLRKHLKSLSPREKTLIEKRKQIRKDKAAAELKDLL